VPDTTVLEAGLGSKVGRTVGGILFDREESNGSKAFVDAPPGTVVKRATAR
jgi:hypothetical protein